MHLMGRQASLRPLPCPSGWSRRTTAAGVWVCSVAGAPSRCRRSCLGYAQGMSMPAIDIDSMSAEERVRLIAELWDSLPEDAPEPSDAERAELDRRLDDMDADIAAGKSLGSSWTDVRARIEARRDRK